MFVGEGALVAIRALAGTNVAVIHAPSIERDPSLLDQINRAIAAPTVRHFRWSGGEPTIDIIVALSAQLREQRPDVVVAVGGGSVIDAARAAWLLYEYPSIDLSQSGARIAVPRLRGLARFAAVPTTAGAGAEVSSAVVLTNTAGSKVILVSGEFLPDIVILDPRTSAGVPASLFRQSLGDVLSHVVEGHCSRVVNPFVGEMTRQLFPRLWQTFTAQAGTADELLSSDQRLLMMQHALQAGWIQNHRPPGLGHAVSHALANVQVPHAVAAGLCLAPSLRVNLEHQGTRAALEDLGSTVGLPSAEALIDRIDTTMRAIQSITPSIRARIGERTEALVSAALADVTARTNPIPVHPAMVEQVLEDLP